MDADDFSFPIRLESQVAYMEQNPGIGVSGTLAVFFDGTDFNNNTPKNYLRPSLLNHCCFVHPSVILRKSVIDFHHLEYKGLLEDYFMWTEMSFLTDFGMLNEVLIKYRTSETQISKSVKSERDSEMCNLQIHFAEKWLCRSLSDSEKSFFGTHNEKLSFRLFADLIAFCKELASKEPWGQKDGVRMHVGKFFKRTFYKFDKLFSHSLLLLFFDLLSIRERISLIRKSFC
jgi:hypothetical protein